MNSITKNLYLSLVFTLLPFIAPILTLLTGTSVVTDKPGGLTWYIMNLYDSEITHTFPLVIVPIIVICPFVGYFFSNRISKIQKELNAPRFYNYLSLTLRLVNIVSLLPALIFLPALLIILMGGWQG